MSDFTRVLQAGVGVPPGASYLPADPSTLFWGRLPARDDLPVLTVSPGTELVVDTVSHEGMLEDQGRDPLAWFGAHGVSPDAVLEEAVALAASGHPHDPDVDGPHVVTGPVAIEGAQPGDLVVVTVLDTTPRVPYGVISNRHGKGALPGEHPAGEGNVSVYTPIERDGSGAWVGTLPLVAGGPRVVRFPLAPFLGTIGVAVDDVVRPHSVPPGVHGGNLDIALLTAGSTLYLPVQVPGGNVYFGDPHFAQGDGEVALTALEASLRVTVRLGLVPREQALREFGEVLGPLVETDEFLVPTGLDRDLDEAMRSCVRAAISLVGARWGMSPELALAYLSAATDFGISQVVDVVQGVHAKVRKSDFAAVERG